MPALTSLAFNRQCLHRLRWRTFNCSSLLIYRPLEDERLSWPGWLTSSGRSTHISGRPSAEGRACDSESLPAKTDVLPMCHAANQGLIEITSPLWQITCYMGSHSATCHPAASTFQPLLPAELVLDLATPKGCKAELTWVVVITR